MNKLILCLGLAAFVGTSLSARAEDVAEVKISAEKLTLFYDTKEFTVKAGQKVKLTLANPAGSPFPHNLLIVKPGKKDVVGMASNTAMTDPTYLTEKNAIPESEDILHHTTLVQAGEEDTIEFTAPEEPGDYPYLCTYPGHWAVMNGVMHVE
ncbi:MAG: hypothetical protein CMO55_19100 [Verrucomicrobiales bacterium]|nr:hypothetical protein [Verrucomicrobiales bacterium]